MPLYMDQHDTSGARAEDLARAHDADLDIQDEYRVRFLTYWLDYPAGLANCLVEAPDPETVNRVHAASHGLLANRIIPVDPTTVAALMGRVTDPGPEPIDEPATRTIVFTDMVDSTARLSELGDEAALEIHRAHNRIVRSVLADHHGRELKHTGDGFMLAFDSPSDAVGFSVDLQQALGQHSATHPDSSIKVRIGINTGRPVAEEGDFFGMAVNVAARLCDRAGPGEVLASETVAQLTSGLGFAFAHTGPLELKGVSEPVTGYRLRR